MESQKVLIAGLGLIGGSLCKALRRYTPHTVYGYDLDGAVLEKAEADGSIAGVLTPEQFGTCDIVIVCLHPDATRSFLRANMERFAPDTLVTDVCGIKGALVGEMTALAEQYGAHYVGMHPMAGKERFGYAFSDGSLFLGANCIVTPMPDTDGGALCQLEQMIHALGFGRIIETSPAQHDAMIAYTSQLAHVVSSAYVKSPTLQTESGFSGGSFQDMTRIATLNEDMWTSLFLENRECLLFEVDTLLSNLTAFRDALDAKDGAHMRELLKEGRLLKEANLLAHNRDRRE